MARTFALVLVLSCSTERVWWPILNVVLSLSRFHLLSCNLWNVIPVTEEQRYSCWLTDQLLALPCLGSCSSSCAPTTDIVFHARCIPLNGHNSVQDSTNNPWMAVTCHIHRPRRARHQQTFRIGVAAWPVICKHGSSRYFVTGRFKSRRLL